jgi:hypothetical protein
LPASGATDDLSELRSSASKWQAAQLGIIGLVSVVGLVKGSQDVRLLSEWAGVTIGVLLCTAFFVALYAVYLVAFVAYRLPRLRRRTAGDADVTTWRTLSEASQRLVWGVRLTFLAAVLVATAVGLTWYAPDREVVLPVQVTSEGARYCGQLLGVDGGAVTVTMGGGRKVLEVGASVQPARSCP